MWKWFHNQYLGMIIIIPNDCTRSQALLIVERTFGDYQLVTMNIYRVINEWRTPMKLARRVTSVYERISDVIQRDNSYAAHTLADEKTFCKLIFFGA